MTLVSIAPSTLKHLDDAADAKSLHTAIADLNLSNVFISGREVIESDGSKVVSYQRNDGHWTFMRREGELSAGVAVREEKLQPIFGHLPQDYGRVFGKDTEPLIVVKDIANVLIDARRAQLTGVKDNS